jgi:5-methyltetrahydropteroyltriglutamate--homocysteine methyltransferase
MPLLDAREQHARGEIDDEALRGVEDEAIRDVVKMQQDVGLRTATDGEFRRASWHMDFIYALEGVGRAEGDIQVQFRNEQGTLEFTSAALHIDSPIRLDGPIFGEHFRFLKSAAEGTGLTPKLTIPSPSMVHYRGGPAAIDPAVYPEEELFWADLTAAYAKQLRAMADLGCTYLQLDDVSLAYLNDPKQRERMAAMGGDAEHQHEHYIRQINKVLAGELGAGADHGEIEARDQQESTETDPWNDRTSLRARYGDHRPGNTKTSYDRL